MTFLILALALNLSSGQAVPSPLPVVAADDPIRPVLDRWKEDRTARYEERREIRPRFSEWREIRTEDLKALFPGFRFAVITWDEMPHPEAKEATIGRATGLQETLAVDAKTLEVTAFPGTGNYEEFGRFLNRRSVKIASEADARKVWGAFCDIHRKAWRGQGIVHVDETTWRLGVTAIDDFRYFYEITVDVDRKVTEGRLRSEKR